MKADEQGQRAVEGEPSEPREAGVSLRQYAVMMAVQADGYPIEAGLARAGLDARVWAAADPAWSDRLAGATVSDEALLNAYNERLIEAHDELGRRIPPLDEE